MESISPMDDPNTNCCADCEYFLRRIYISGLTDRKCLVDNTSLLERITSCNFYELKYEEDETDPKDPQAA